MKNYPVKIGEYCTAYYKGIFKLLDIDTTPGKSSFGLAKLQMICDSAYNKRGGIKFCDISYCTPVTKESLLQKAENAHKTLVEKINEVLH